MDEHIEHEVHGTQVNMSYEDDIYIRRLQRKDRIKGLIIMLFFIIILLMIIFILSTLEIGRGYLSFGFILVFLLLHVYMMRGMFRRR